MQNNPPKPPATQGGAPYVVNMVVNVEDGSTASDIHQTAYINLPPLKTVLSSAPQPTEHFTGRRSEIEYLAGLLKEAGGPRIIALHGMGGIGKTDLARKLADEVKDFFSGGVFWVDSLESKDAFPILSGWASKLGDDVSRLTTAQARADKVRSLFTALQEQGQRVLIILDSVRQEMLEDVRVLISTRPSEGRLLMTTIDEALGLELDAKAVELKGLAADEAIELLENLAGEEFIASQLDEAKKLVELVDYLPLALTLAGKLARQSHSNDPHWRLRTLVTKVEQSAHKALKLPIGTSLQATFSVSYETLNPTEQKIFRAVAAFSPYLITPEHVAAVMHRREQGWFKRYLRRSWEAFLSEAALWHPRVSENQVEQVRSALETLERFSLISLDSRFGSEYPRYTIHRLLHSYAGELLEEAREFSATHDAHLNYYLNYGREHRFSTPDDNEALDLEFPNILVAMNRAYTQGYWKDVCRLMWVLDNLSGSFMMSYGYWQDLKSCYHKAMKAAQKLKDENTAAAFQGNLAILLKEMGDYQAARQEYERLVIVFGKLNNFSDKAVALYRLGEYEHLAGNLSKAREFYLSSLDTYRQIKPRYFNSLVIKILRKLAAARQGTIQAERLNKQIRQFESTGKESLITNSMENLANIAEKQGNLTEAKERYREALDMAQATGKRTTQIQIITSLVSLAVSTGSKAEAEEHYASARQLVEAIRVQQDFDVNDYDGALSNMARMALALGRYDDAAQFVEESLTLGTARKDRLATARAWAQLGEIYRARHDYADARRAYHNSLTIHESLGSQLEVANSLNEIGFTFNLEAKFDEAEQFYRKSLKKYETLQLKPSIAGTLGQLADVAEQTGKVAEALSFREQSLEMFRDLEEPLQIANSIAGVGWHHTVRGNLAQAFSAYNEALTIYQRLNNDLGIADISLRLAQLHLTMGDHLESRKLTEKSLSIYTQMSSEQGIAGASMQLGSIMHYLTQYADAFNLHQSSLQIFQTLDDKLGIANGLYNLASIYAVKGDYEQAMEMTTGALQIYSDTNDMLSIATATRQLGSFEEVKANYSAAKQMYDESLRIYLSFNARLEVAETWKHLGSLNVQLGQFTEAEELYRKSLEVFCEVNAKPQRAELLVLQGSLNQFRGDYKVSEELYEKARQIFAEINSKHGSAFVTGNLVSLYLEQENYTRAEILIKQSLSAYRDIKAQLPLSQTLNIYAYQQILTHSYPEAESLLDESLTMFIQMGYAAGLAENKFLRGLLLYQKGDYSKAQELIHESLTISQEKGIPIQQAKGTLYLGKIASKQNEIHAAETSLLRSLEVSERIGYKKGIAEASFELSLLARGQNKDKEAAYYITRSHETYKLIGYIPESVEKLAATHSDTNYESKG